MATETIDMKPGIVKVVQEQIAPLEARVKELEILVLQQQTAIESLIASQKK